MLLQTEAWFRKSRWKLSIKSHSELRWKFFCCWCFFSSFPSTLPLLPWPRPPGLLLWYPRGPRGTGLLLPLQPHLHRKAPRLPPKYLHRFFLSLPLRCGERPLAASPRFHRRPRKYLRPPSAVAVGLLLHFDRNPAPGGSNRRCSHSDSNRCSKLILWILI